MMAYLEMVDKTLHAFLHGSSRGRDNLVVVNLVSTVGDLVKTLSNDSKGLSEFLHSAEISVI